MLLALSGLVLLNGCSGTRVLRQKAEDGFEAGHTNFLAPVTGSQRRHCNDANCSGSACRGR
jgi:hypothetical protein